MLEDGPRVNGCGTVYAIVHIPSQRRYIGATTTTLVMRMRGHLSPLTKNVHTVADLQADWNRDGPEAFAVEVLERAVPATALADTENRWMSRYASEPGGIYNKQRERPPFRFGRTTIIERRRPARPTEKDDAGGKGE